MNAPIANFFIVVVVLVEFLPKVHRNNRKYKLKTRHKVDAI